MKKRLLLFCVSVLSFLMVSVPAIAKEPAAEVQLGSVIVETEFAKDDVDIHYYEDSIKNEIHADIVDKATGQIVCSYIEVPSIPISSLPKAHLLRAQQTYTTTLQKNKTVGRAGSRNFTAYVWARVQVTADFSWGQVDKVLACGHSAGGSGAYTLNPQGTFVHNQKFPSNKFVLDINGVIEVSKTQSISAGLSFSTLKGAGFSMSASESHNWYARKSYNTSVTFKLR